MIYNGLMTQLYHLVDNSDMHHFIDTSSYGHSYMWSIVLRTDGTIQTLQLTWLYYSLNRCLCHCNDDPSGGHLGLKRLSIITLIGYHCHGTMLNSIVENVSRPSHLLLF